jgi:hypothetical protein
MITRHIGTCILSLVFPADWLLPILSYFGKQQHKPPYFKERSVT